MISRREILTALLSISASSALPSCARRSRAPGDIVGADVTTGHLLRQDLAGAIAARTESIPVVIVGAGIAGLSAAWRLAASQAAPFAVLELESCPGGTSRPGAHPVTPFPWGAHYVPTPASSNRTLVRLLREMNVVTGLDDAGEPIVDEACLVPEPEERVFWRGEWHEGLMPEAALTADDHVQMDRFKDEVARWVRWRDGRGRRAFELPMAASSDDAEVVSLDRQSMGEWMDERGLSSPRLRWWVDYACRDDYGCRLDTTSAWAALFYFASRVRTAGGSSQPLITWPDGNGGVVRHLARVAGPRLRTSMLVHDLVPHEDHVQVLALDATTRQAVQIRAEQVVLAVPRFIAGRVLRPWRDDPPSDLREFETAPWVVANLFLRDRPANRGFVPAWDNVFYESTSLGYVTATHQRGRRHGPTVLTWYHAMTSGDPRGARESLLSASREEWVEAIVTDMERAHPEITSLVERIDMCRWGHAMVRPRPGFVWGKARRRAALPVGRVHMACTDLSGVALIEEAQYHGVRAAEEVLRERGDLGPSWI